MRLYAIGDIHGQREKLRAVHALVAADREACGDYEAPLVHLGDHTDRGPDSRGVIDDILDGISSGLPWTSIRGNHDQLFLDFLHVADQEDPRFDLAKWWLQPNLGGPATLASYGVNVADFRDFWLLQAAARSEVPGSHRAFLEGLPYQFETPELYCVHAGVRPGIPFDRQKSEDLIWIRDDFLFDERDHGKLIVHGHTPADVPENHGNRVNLDTGAGYGRTLSVAVFEPGRQVSVLTKGGRVPLPPY